MSIGLGNRDGAEGDPAEDRQIGSLARWAMLEQIQDQEPSASVWQAIRARTTRASAARQRSMLHWAPLASGLIAITLMLGSTYSFWGYDAGSAGRSQSVVAGDVSPTPDLSVEALGPISVEIDAPSASAMGGTAQRSTPTFDSLARESAKAGDTQHQLSGADNMPQQAASPAAAPTAPFSVQSAARPKPSSSTLEYGPDLPKAVRRVARPSLLQQPAPAAPALPEIIKGRPPVPI